MQFTPCTAYKVQITGKSTKTTTEWSTFLGEVTVVGALSGDHGNAQLMIMTTTGEVKRLTNYIAALEAQEDLEAVRVDYDDPVAAGDLEKIEGCLADIAEHVKALHPLN